MGLLLKHRKPSIRHRGVQTYPYIYWFPFIRTLLSQSKYLYKTYSHLFGKFYTFYIVYLVIDTKVEKTRDTFTFDKFEGRGGPRKDVSTTAHVSKSFTVPFCFCHLEFVNVSQKG